MMRVTRDRASPAPQSNQRGIETSFSAHRSSRSHVSLNRTSVGLKPGGWWMKWVKEERPQSNQRGIETQDRRGRRHVREGASIEPAWD